MKFTRILGVVGAWALFTACARSPDASAPAANSGTSSFTTAPTEAADSSKEAAAPTNPAPPPAPAAAPPGLDRIREPEAAKSRALDDEFENLEQAERAMNQAKSDLDRLALGQPAPVVGRSTAADGAPEKKNGKGGPSPAGAAAGAAPNAVCENACRAFSSLSRAASAVCRLDSSSGGGHCARAKRVVAESQQRVATCTCAASKD